MARRFRKKPVVVEAVQWRGRNYAEIEDFVGVRRFTVHNESGGPLIIPTLEGDMQANVDDWIIKGVQGEFYPCKPDIFAATYEEQA
jgi:hypothetical protein